MHCLTRTAIAALVVATGLGGADLASASTLTVTYTGVVNSDSITTYDAVNGWQTLSSSQYVGDSITATWTYDTSLGLFQSGPGITQLSGGLGSSTGSPGNAYVMVGNSSFTVEGNREDEVFANVPPATPWDQFESYTEYDSVIETPGMQNVTQDAIGAEVQTFPASGGASFTNGDIYSPINYNPLPGEGSGGFNLITATEYSTGQYITYYDQQVTFTLTSVTSSVPEPATWAMMLIGFAGVGFTASRQGARSRKAAA